MRFSFFPFRDSIATQLLAVVFSFYFLVAAVVTVAHMAAEFFNAKQDLRQNLESLSHMFSPALGEALWNLNDAQVLATLQGLLTEPTVVGAKVEYMEEDDNPGFRRKPIVLGRTTGAKEQDTGLGQALAVNLIDLKADRGLFWQTTALWYRKGSEERRIGVITLYSHSALVFGKVRRGYAFIVVNAVIKSLALWIIFQVTTRIMLGKPLGILRRATEEVRLDRLDDLTINVGARGHNELKVLEEAFNAMISQLRKGRERSASLRTFAHRIAHFNDTAEMLGGAVDELYKHAEADRTVLYELDEPGHYVPTQARGSQTSATLPLPGPEQLQLWYKDQDQEVLVHNLPGPSTTSLLPKSKVSSISADATRAGHYLAFPFEQHWVLLLREARHRGFDRDDVDYCRAMRAEMNMVLHNLRSIRERTRMEGELKTAAAVQKALFPKILPRIPNLELATFFASASETGGDWYGFLTYQDDALYILIGDVTGHGTPAALVTATASATCRTLEALFSEQPQAPSPSTMLHHLNRAIFDAGYPDFLMTFFIGRLDLHTGQLQYANAAHNFPLLLRAQAAPQALAQLSHPLGRYRDLEFQEETLTLQAGDQLVFYTDGLLENVNAKDEVWGRRHLFQTLKTVRELSAKEAVRQVTQAAYAFWNDHPLDDDVSLVICRVEGAFAGAELLNNDAVRTL